MRQSLLLWLGVILIATIFVGCQDDQGAAADRQISKAVLDRIWEMGFSNADVQKIDEGYLVEGDIILTDEDLQISVDPITLRIAETEQYRTNNLVTGLPRTITVSMDSQLNGTAGYSAALDECISRYNSQNLQITMVRVGTSGGNIHLKKQPGNYLASSGFPTSSGNPYSQVKMNSNAIGSGNSSTFINYCATIMAHEIGHCIGFRHTDYMNRAYSCGTGGNEGDGGVGAVLIPGTPSGPDSGSWMLACISNLQNRPFNNNDKTALGYLY